MSSPGLFSRSNTPVFVNSYQPHLRTHRRDEWVFKLPDYVMITVSDMSRSVKFYRDVLGLSLKSESPDWTEFSTGTTMLALHGGGRPKPRTETDTGATFAGTCTIGFNVDDLDKTFEELKTKGVHFLMPPTERLGEPIKLAVCMDPDGLPISMAQPVEPQPRRVVEAGINRQ